MQDWSAKKYLLLEDERTNLARVLAHAIALQTPKTIIDINCGTGNSTEI